MVSDFSRFSRRPRGLVNAFRVSACTRSTCSWSLTTIFIPHTGFDLGTENCVIAVARKGGIDIIANEASYRTTPALVTFGDSQRFIGQSAAAQFKRNVASTVSNVKRLLGRRFSEEDVQKELPFLNYKIKAIDDNDEIGIEIKQGGETKTLTPVQVCGALLGQLKRTAEDSLGQEVKEVVIGVPGWWNDRQRRALQDSAMVAGLHCLQLVNELTACALELGIRKDRLLEKDSELVVFFDMGDTQTQCAIMRYSKGKLEVLGYGYDSHLGGRNFTEALVQHFQKEWLEKHKIDINTNARARLRTAEACQKLKHVLSSNATGNVSLDCLLNDKDVQGKLGREAFEGMVQDLLKKVLAPVQQALDAAGVDKEAIQSVEVVGDSHRIPAVNSQLQSFFGKAPSKRTNATEVVAKGAAWQCARKSPLFKVMPYECKDLQSYPINFEWRWEANGEEEKTSSSLVFPPHSAVPLFKQVTLKKNIVPGMSFAAAASYAEGATTPLPAGTAMNIGSWKISNIPADSPAMVEGEKSSLKVGCKLDDSGIVYVSRVEKEWNEEIEFEEEQDVPLSEDEQKVVDEADAKKKKEEAEAAEAAAAATAAAAAAAKESAEAEKGEGEKKADDAAAADEEPKKADEATDEPAAAAAPTPAPTASPAAKQPKTKRVKVTKKKVQARSQKLEIQGTTTSLSDAALKRFQEQETAMIKLDLLVVATAEVKNKVEAYVYEAREKLSDTWASFATDEIKDELRNLLEKTENWLYEEGENETKDVYSSKLAELHTLGDPMALRAREADERGPATEELRSAAKAWLAWSEGSDPAYAHLTDEEKKSVKDKATSAVAWLQEELAKQAKLGPTDNPAVLTADINARRLNLNKESNVVRNKPKPKAEPKKEEPKKEESKKEEAKKEEGPKPEEGDAKQEEGEAKPEEGEAKQEDDPLPPLETTPAAEPMDTSN